MDVIQIHKALTTIWPGGIPREGFVALAGMIKALVDKTASRVAPAQNRSSSTPSEIEQALAASLAVEATTYVISEIDTQNRTITLTAEQSKAKDRAPKPEPRSAPPKVLARVKSYLRSVGAKTQADIAKNLKLGLWTVKRAIWQLQREGEITRHETVQGPHLYQIAPTLPLGL